MFSHVTIGSNDIARSGTFYDAVLGALGHTRFYASEHGIGYGETEGDQVWILGPFDGKPATVGNGMMVAFVAPDRSSVDAAFAAAMANGGAEEGAPAVREHYHPNYYGAYFRDPEGNKLCTVCHASPA